MLALFVPSAVGHALSLHFQLLLVAYSHLRASQMTSAAGAEVEVTFHGMTPSIHTTDCEASAD